MANEVSWRHTATAKTVYYTIRSAARQMWNTSGTPAFEALTVVNWADYDIALAETPASSYFYVGDWPAGVSTVGWYWLDVYEQATASPAISDTLIGGIIGYWNSTTLSPWAADVTQISGDSTAADNAKLMFDGTGYAGGTTKLDVNTATIANAAITAAAIATNAIDADALAADGLAEIADAVWDEAIAGHADAGSTGAALSAAGAAGDPWITALPGAYAAGSAGDIIGNLVTDIGALTPAVAISATTAASVSTGALAVRTYHSLSQAISSTYAGNLNAATKLWLAVKAEKDDTDAQAVIFIEKAAGLTVLAGAAYTTVAHGSLTIGGLAGAWTVTVALDEVATGLLTPYADCMAWAECKALVAGSTVAVWDGVCDVARGIVNAVS